MFRPTPRVELIPVAGTSVCVIDDALLEPGHFVEQAASRLREFRQAPYNAYPGIELRLPDPLSGSFATFFDQHLRGYFGLRRTVRQHAKLAMVTLPEDQLQPVQTIPHQDALAQRPEEQAMAAVLYLFRDAQLGGTSFYQPRAEPGRLRTMLAEASSGERDAFWSRHGMVRGYPGATNAWFERVHTVTARWNRLVVYPGALLHSGEIPRPDLLRPDPRSGRLTLNAFMTCRRRLQA
jgi:hypothetical protein